MDVSRNQSEYLSNNMGGNNNTQDISFEELQDGDEELIPSSSSSSMKLNNDLNRLNYIQKQRIRERSAILGKQIHPDKNDMFIEQQIRAFQQKLNIDDGGSIYGNGIGGSLNTLNVNANTFADYKGKGRASTFETQASKNYDFPEMDIEELSSMNLGLESDLQSMLSGQSYQDYLKLFQQQYSIENMNETAAAYEPVFSTGVNRFSSHADPMTAAEQAHAQGDLFLAIEALEEALRRKETSEGWRRLGSILAETDDDERAIACFTRAVRVDPNDLQSLLNLGVSYTNELDKVRALVYLHHWIISHPVYSHVLPDHEIKDYGFHMLHSEVMNAINRIQDNENDSDVDMIRGVLFHLVEEYEHAILNFRKAVKKNPNDYTAWNKLGATHANCRESDKAIECYRRALKIRPNYLRAWVNLGIAYANSHKNQEAVVVFLRVLSMAKSIQGNLLKHVWNYLSLSLSFMGRDDLVRLCEERDVELFRQHFKF